MHNLRQVLLPALAEQEGEIARALFVRARHCLSDHYRHVDKDLLDRRCKSAVAAFCESLRTSPAWFSDYVAFVARERLEAGYELGELQLLLNALEELLWRVCIDAFEDKDELVWALSVVSGTVGQAKDRMARVYLLNAGEKRRDIDEDLLFAGT